MIISYVDMYMCIYYTCISLFPHILGYPKILPYAFQKMQSPHPAPGIAGRGRAHKSSVAGGSRGGGLLPGAPSFASPHKHTPPWNYAEN